MEQVWSALRSIIDYLSKLDFSNVKDIIKTKVGLFIIGFFGGGGSIGSFLFLDASVESVTAITIVVKSIGTILVAFMTGIATALGKNYVDHKRKEKEIKQKREEMKRDLEEGHVKIWSKNGTNH